MSFYVLDEDQEDVETAESAWQPWDGKQDRPPGVDASVRVDIMFRNGVVNEAGRIGSWTWRHRSNPMDSDIVSWRLHNDETAGASQRPAVASPAKSKPVIDRLWIAWGGNPGNADTPPRDLPKGGRIQVVFRNNTSETHDDPEDVSWNLDPPGSVASTYDVVYYRSAPDEVLPPPGWRAWRGDSSDMKGDMPRGVDRDTGVNVLYRDGSTRDAERAGEIVWHWTDDVDDVIAFFVVEKEGKTEESEVEIPDDFTEWVPSTTNSSKDDNDNIYPSELSLNDEVEVIDRDGDKREGQVEEIVWEHEETGGDVVGYRVIKKGIPAGWTEWRGSVTPPRFSRMMIMLRGSHKLFSANEGDRDALRWSHDGNDGDIVAFKPLDEGEIYLDIPHSANQIANAIDLFVSKYGRSHPEEAEILRKVSRMVFSRRNR